MKKYVANETILTDNKTAGHTDCEGCKEGCTEDCTGAKPLAELTGDVFQPDDPDLLDTHYFLLRCENRDFLMSLESILECLKFAEASGLVPKLPVQWWSAMISAYPSLEEPVKVD